MPKQGREARELLRWETGVSAAGYSYSISRVRAFAVFGDETLDPRPEKRGQRYRAELEHRIVERADVEFETRSFPNLLVATLAILP